MNDLTRCEVDRFGSTETIPDKKPSRVRVQYERFLESPWSALSRLNSLRDLDQVWIEGLPIARSGNGLERVGLLHLLALFGWTLENDDPAASFGVLRRLKQAAKYRVVAYSEEDEETCLGLFSRSFGEEMPRALWHWKYGEGRGLSVLVWRENQLVAHYGCSDRQILFHGLEGRAVQICDVMVDPQERAVMSRNGAFVQAATASQHWIIGLDGRYLLGFGFPNERAMRMGERTSLYREADSITEVSWKIPQRLFSWKYRLREFDFSGSQDERYQALWQKMAGSFQDAIIGVRDPDYLRHRYHNHPNVAYELFVLEPRWGSQGPLGILVLRNDGETCRLMDLIAPKRHIPELISQALRLSHRLGAKRMIAWITSRYGPLFQSQGAKLQPAGIKIPVNAIVERVLADQVNSCWWLMMGDTDFL